MTPDEEYALYTDPMNQQPQGPPRRRGESTPSATVPVRFRDHPTQTAAFYAEREG